MLKPLLRNNKLSGRYIYKLIVAQDVATSVVLNIIHLSYMVDIIHSYVAADNLNNGLQSHVTFENFLSFTIKATFLQRTILLVVPDSLGQDFTLASSANKYYFSDNVLDS